MSEIGKWGINSPILTYMVEQGVQKLTVHEVLW